MVKECPMERLDARTREAVRFHVNRYRDHHLRGEGLARELVALGFSRAEASRHVELVRATEE